MEGRYLAMSAKVEETFSAEALIYSLRRRRKRESAELIPEGFCLEAVPVTGIPVPLQV